MALGSLALWHIEMSMVGRIASVVRMVADFEERIVAGGSSVAVC